MSRAIDKLCRALCTSFVASVVAGCVLASHAHAQAHQPAPAPPPMLPGAAPASTRAAPAAAARPVPITPVAPLAPTAPPAGAPTGNQANDDVARGLFQAGKSAYEAGNYQDALQFFEQAYARSPRNGFLFNIGQVADRLRQDDKALSSFKAYLEREPNAPNREEVESRIHALEEARAARDAEAKSQPNVVVPTPAETAQSSQSAQSGSTNDALTASQPTAAADSDKPVTQKWWFWTGLGAVVIGGTAVALAVALGGDAGRAPLYKGSAGSLAGP